MSKHGNTTHGESHQRTPEYEAWKKMKQRCYNSKNKDYILYGFRGIFVCDEWIDNYSAFLAYIGRRPSSLHSLDRIESDGNYEPGNVQWSLPDIQGKNRRNVDVIQFNGKKQTIVEWAKELNIKYATLRFRLLKGDIEKAMTTKVQTHVKS